MSNGPPPSQLCLVSDLPSRSIGDKVRFLGCVQSYSASSASLILSHDFPPGHAVEAVVDVRLVLEKLSGRLTADGAWINVIGYLAKVNGQLPISGVPTDPSKLRVDIEAILVWSAGSLDIAKYEESLTHTKTIDEVARKQPRLSTAAQRPPPS